MSAVDEAVRILRRRAHGAVTPSGSIAPLTSYRLGGPAAVLLEVAGDEDLDALAEAVDATGLDVLVIGRGSNMLVSDRGFDGIAVRLGAGFRWAEREGTDVRAGAAMPLPALATLGLHEELAGLEFAVAIPASLGGAVRMNAGAHGREMSDVLATVDLFHLAGARRETVPASALGLSYRRSSLGPGSIVTGARMTLRAGVREEIAAGIDAAKDWRRRTQPVNLPNGGSVFKNPPNDKAGRLVEEVCGKGMAVGAARVSEVHANFIVVEDGATADQVYTLMRRIQRMVAERTGIELEPELKLMGSFQEVTDGS